MSEPLSAKIDGVVLRLEERAGLTDIACLRPEKPGIIEDIDIANIEVNTLRTSLGAWTRYDNFLAIILRRHDDAVQSFRDAGREFNAWVASGAGELTEAAIRSDEAQRATGPAIELEIESFYLFAKILLDGSPTRSSTISPIGSEARARLTASS